MLQGYRRALLKVSGEALAGEKRYGIDPMKTSWIAGEIARAAHGGREIALVVGAGNIMRGADAASVGVSPLTADAMGMIATVLNAMAVQAALQKQHMSAVVLSAFPVGVFVETYSREKAMERLAEGYVTILAGGTGNPCFTTDTAAALRAVEIEADVMVKGTQVDGVYDDDPRTNPNAVFYDRISPAEVLNRGLRVIDGTCADILGRHSLPAVILNLHKEGNLAAALAGEKVGTLIL